MPRIVPEARLHIESHGHPARVRTVAVVLHGDGAPDDGETLAQTLAARLPDAIGVAVLRPGYVDANGHRSPGERGLDTGDNFTPEAIGAVAATVERLRQRHPHANIVLIGHSGGAALAANLAGGRPALVDGLVLAACPCSLPEWRRFRQAQQPKAGFDQPVRSLDPLQTVGGATLGLRVALLVGTDDKLMPPRFSRPYAEALALRGIATDFRILPGKGNAILNDPELISAVERLAAALPRKG